MDAGEGFEPPEWFGAEVTDDDRFANQSLAQAATTTRSGPRRGPRTRFTDPSPPILRCLTRRSPPTPNLVDDKSTSEGATMIPSNGRAAMSLAEVRIGSGARADMHCHSTASEVSKLGVQRSARAAGVRDAARGGLRARQAPRHGLRDDHRPRHDRRLPRDRRPRRRVRLRGADRPLRRRAPGGARPLLRDHARTTTSGCRRTPPTSRSARPTCTSARSPARSRIRSMPSPRR